MFWAFLFYFEILTSLLASVTLLPVLVFFPPFWSLLSVTCPSLTCECVQVCFFSSLFVTLSLYLVCLMFQPFHGVSGPFFLSGLWLFLTFGLLPAPWLVWALSASPSSKSFCFKQNYRTAPWVLLKNWNMFVDFLDRLSESCCQFHIENLMLTKMKQQ